MRVYPRIKKIWYICAWRSHWPVLVAGISNEVFTNKCLHANAHKKKMVIFCSHLFHCRTEIQPRGQEGREISRPHLLQIHLDWKSDRYKSFVLLRNCAWPDVGPKSGRLMSPISWRKTIWPWGVYSWATEDVVLVRSRERNWGPTRGQKLLQNTL